VRVGPGLDLDPIRWNVQVFASWQDRNFMGDLRRLMLEAHVGYAYLPTPFRPYKEGPVWLLAADFSQPGAFTRWVDASARLEYERGVLQGYDFQAQRLKLSLPLRLAPRWKLVPSFNVEVYTLSNYGALFTPSLVPGVGEPALENCKGNVCLLSYLEQLVFWDGRDEPLNTHRGVYVGITVQEGLDIATYGYRYLRFVPEARFFRPIAGPTVFASRFRLGALVPLGEPGLPPLAARFTAGGPVSMRGYYPGRLAPMVLQGDQWIPLGGNGVVDGSLELRFPLSGPVGAAVFVDAAAVSNASGSPTEWQHALDVSTLQWAAGFALRYLTPFGPLRLDVGFRIPTRWSLSPSAFPSVPYTRYPDGGFHHEPLMAIHLSLGEAF
jgi:translocation and assembly module TamA